MLGGAFTPANSGRFSTSSISIATMVREAGLERITAFALLSAAANFSTVEMSGLGAPARTARPIRVRPSGLNVPGDAAVQGQRGHQLERQHDDIRRRILFRHLLDDGAHADGDDANLLPCFLCKDGGDVG